jgi:hypothetical protein
MEETIEGYVFAQIIDEGFPSSYQERPGRPTIAERNVIFVKSTSLEKALQFLMDNHDWVFRHKMQGAYVGLYELAKAATSTTDLKRKIDASRVNGDSEAKVIYEHLSLKELPHPNSKVFLRFFFSDYEIRFDRICHCDITTPRYEPMRSARLGPSYQADIQLEHDLLYDVDVDNDDSF